MNLDSDLAKWGEPPATPVEKSLGTFLEKVSARLDDGQVAPPDGLHGSGAAPVDEERDLVRTLHLLYECAETLRDTPAPGDGPAAPGRSTAPSGGPPTGGAGADLPDPFPGEFRIERALGEGAYGKVWLAEDLQLGRLVAIKSLKLPATSTLGPQVLAALRHEAGLLAKLEHPHIVRVHAWRSAGGESYLILQFVRGGALADRVRSEGGLGWQAAACYMADVGEALIETHRRGVVHRDIKPENVLWDADRDEALVTDFGISARLAEPGDVAGTPMYMAPEAFDGQVSPALDVYGLAATLYRLATGALPFAPATIPELVRQKRQGPPTDDPRWASIPEPLERLLRDGLAAAPSSRPGLPDFVQHLRGDLNHLLADAIGTPDSGPSGAAGPGLELTVSRWTPQDGFRPIGSTTPTPVGRRRDMRVPRAPERVGLRTGERVRIEVRVAEPGYLAVVNIGPEGNVNWLYPSDDPPPARVEPNRPLVLAEVEMTPPVGRERLVAIWSRVPLPDTVGALRHLLPGEPAISAPARGTRDMKRVQQSVASLPPDARRTVVLELDHRPPDD